MQLKAKIVIYRKDVIMNKFIEILKKNTNQQKGENDFKLFRILSQIYLEIICR